MLTKSITFKDYNGNTRTEEFLFNLNKAELMEMHLGTTGGLDQIVRRIIAAQDNAALVKIFKDLILKAYGEKSLDGKYFMKEDENGRPLSKKFEQTDAYSVLFMELSTDADKAVAFITDVMPEDLREKALAESKKFEQSLPKPEPNN